MRVSVKAPVAKALLKREGQAGGLRGEALEAFSKTKKEHVLVYNVDGNGAADLVTVDGSPVMNVGGGRIR